MLAPFQLSEARFDSIGVNCLLHCLPGTFREKVIALDHLLSLLNPGGVLFGSTILGAGAERGSFARALMALYNRMGVFNNDGDRPGDLEACLRSRCSQVEFQVVGCVALFSGRVA